MVCLVKFADIDFFNRRSQCLHEGPRPLNAGSGRTGKELSQFGSEGAPRPGGGGKKRHTYPPVSATWVCQVPKWVATPNSPGSGKWPTGNDESNHPRGGGLATIREGTTRKKRGIPRQWFQRSQGSRTFLRGSGPQCQMQKFPLVLGNKPLVLLILKAVVRETLTITAWSVHLAMKRK